MSGRLGAQECQRILIQTSSLPHPRTPSIKFWSGGTRCSQFPCFSNFAALKDKQSPVARNIICNLSQGTIGCAPRMFTSDTCAPYSITDSSVSDCGPINACPGDTVVVDNCDSCKEGSRLLLTNVARNRLRAKEDICGKERCSKLTYTVPNGAPCQDYTARQGCFGKRNCSGTTFISVVPSTVVESFWPRAHLSVFSTNACGGETRGAPVLLDQCVRLSKKGFYAKFSCASHSADASWTLKLFQSEKCDSAGFVGATKHSGACGCSALSYDSTDDGYDADFSSAGLSLNCASSVAPAPCDTYILSDVQPTQFVLFSTFFSPWLASTSELSKSPATTSVTVVSLATVSTVVLLGVCYFLYVVFCRSRKIGSRPVSPVAKV